jgi:hypothetical protein
VSEVMSQKAALASAALLALAASLFWMMREQAHPPVGGRDDASAASSVSAPPTDDSLPKTAPSTSTVSLDAIANGPKSWDQRMASLDAEGVEAVARFATKYPDALGLFNAEQMEWAVRAGIPTPEQIAAAEAMNVEALEAAADAGNATAAVLAADRRLDMMEQRFGGEDFEAYNQGAPTREGLLAFAVAQRWMDRLNLTSCSIMAPHIQMRAMRLIYGTPSPGMELAAWARVAGQGDWRAEQKVADLLASMGVRGASASSLTFALNDVSEIGVQRGKDCPSVKPLPQ